MLRQDCKDGDGWVDNSGGDVCGDEFVIVSTVEEEDGAPLYWRNEGGWGYREDATVFSEYEKGMYKHIPADSHWEKVVEAKFPFSILYTIEYGEIMRCGPFKSEQLAMKYVGEHRYTGNPDQTEYEFDLNEQHVYLLHPDHRMIELEDGDVYAKCSYDRSFRKNKF